MNFKKPFKLSDVSNVFGEALSNSDINTLTKAFHQSSKGQKVVGHAAEQSWVEMTFYIMAGKLEVQYGQLVQAFFTSDKGAMALLNIINHNRAKYNAAVAEHNAKYPNIPEAQRQLKDYWDLSALKAFWHHQWADFASTLTLKSVKRQEYAGQQKKVPAPAKRNDRKSNTAPTVKVETRSTKKKVA